MAQTLTRKTKKQEVKWHNPDEPCPEIIIPSQRRTYYPKKTNYNNNYENKWNPKTKKMENTKIENPSPHVAIPITKEWEWYEEWEHYEHSRPSMISYITPQYWEYQSALQECGAEPILMDLDMFKEQKPENIQGILIPGGSDINPKIYDRRKHKLCGYPDDERDELEFFVAKFAMENDIPILGVCRGHQMMNIAAGGTLYQDISIAKKKYISHQASHHNIFIEAKGLFQDIVKVNGFQTNSYHHQCLREIPEIFKVSAISSDGIVEAITAPDLTFAVGVQFHPESLENEHQKNIIRALIEAADKRVPEEPLQHLQPEETREVDFSEDAKFDSDIGWSRPIIDLD